MINIDNKFNIGDTICLLTDTEAMPRVVTSLTITKNEIIYECYCGVICSKHYDFEMTDEKPVLI